MYRKGILSVVLLACVGVGCGAPTKAPTTTASVTVTVGAIFGSGVCVIRGREIYVWTAAHVVEYAYDPDQNTFTTVTVSRNVVEHGCVVRTQWRLADVIKYSGERDVALLRVRGWLPVQSARFAHGTPDSGTPVTHVGSMLGPSGAQSVTAGIISSHGRLIEGKDFVQSDAAVAPGSSGGGLFDESGKCVGLVLRMHRYAGMTYGVSVDRIRQWARDNGVLWAIDEEVDVPSINEQQFMTVRDSDNAPQIGHAEDEEFPFLIYPKAKDAEEFPFLLRYEPLAMP